ncbi:MAG: serine hydrolase [Rhodothermales bacterium]|nr:serine hydrolase [Rhodothermales bacterium]
MLRPQIDEIARSAGADAVAVSTYDYETETAWSLRGARPFHAASTVKVAVLFGLFDAFERGALPRDGRLHVRNRFLSAADGEPFRVATSRDGNAEVYDALGRTLPLVDLARHMIQTSSNLATNLLVDLVGVEPIRAALHRYDVPGIDVVRGVEDERAWAAGLNNTVTADGLVRLFRVIHDEALSPDSSEAMREILVGQQFRSGIPGGLPEAVRDEAEVAHKTGDISTVTHDAGLVFLPNRAPYAVAILTEWDPEGEASQSERRATVAAVSRVVYDALAAPRAEAADA